MNKKIIALAISAAVAAPMAAQADGPTLYGKLQVELASVDRNSVSTLETDDNKIGRLGIKGSEDLGNGLKGIYKFEWQVETTQANVNDGNREAFVGLKGGFGTFTMGSNKSPYKYMGGVKYDPFVGTYLEARGNGGMLKAEGGVNKKFGTNGFLADSLSYKNKFGNVVFWAVYALGENDPANDDTVLGVKFKIGKAGEVFVTTADEDGVGSNMKFGGQYKMGAHKLSVQLESSEPDGGQETEVMFVGYQMKMGKNTIVAQIGEVDSPAANGDKEYMAVGVIHKMSKSMRAFAGIRSTDADNNANDVDVSPSLGLRVDF